MFTNPLEYIFHQQFYLFRLNIVHYHHLEILEKYSLIEKDNDLSIGKKIYYKMHIEEKPLMAAFSFNIEEIKEKQYYRKPSEKRQEKLKKRRLVIKRLSQAAESERSMGGGFRRQF